jgi:chaperonin GroEL
MRMDDAMHATKAAIEEGIVPGGGVAYIRTQPVLESIEFKDGDEKTGAQIVAKAIEEPLRLIASNAGHEGSIVVGRVKEGPPLSRIPKLTYDNDTLHDLMVRSWTAVITNGNDLNVLKAEDVMCSWGFNAETGQYEDLIDSGVIDPAMVVRVALENAASIAGLGLTTEAIVCEVPDESQPAPKPNKNAH